MLGSPMIGADLLQHFRVATTLIRQRVTRANSAGMAGATFPFVSSDGFSVGTHKISIGQVKADRICVNYP